MDIYNLKYTGEKINDLLEKVDTEEIVDQYFYNEGKTNVLEWDGNTLNLISDNKNYYKISDIFDTEFSIKNSIFTFKDGTNSIEVSIEDVETNDEEGYQYIYMIYVKQDNTYITTDIKIYLENNNFNLSPGIYFPNNSNGYVSFFEINKKLFPKKIFNKNYLELNEELVKEGLGYIPAKDEEYFTTIKNGTNTITWDGNTSSLFHHPSFENYYLISNTTLSLEELNYLKRAQYVSNDGKIYEIKEKSGPGGNITPAFEILFYDDVSTYAEIILNFFHNSGSPSGHYITKKCIVQYSNLEDIATGIYFLKDDNGYVSLFEFSEYLLPCKILKNKYLPQISNKEVEHLLGYNPFNYDRDEKTLIAKKFSEINSKPGFHYILDPSDANPTGFSVTGVFPMPVSAGYGSDIGYLVTNFFTKTILIKNKNDIDWTYVNPPMELYSDEYEKIGGPEYLTLEKWCNNKRLYTKILQFSWEANGSVFDIDVASPVIKYSGVLDKKTLPYICSSFEDPNSCWINFNVENSVLQINMYGGQAYNGEIVTLQIWYSH